MSDKKSRFIEKKITTNYSFKNAIVCHNLGLIPTALISANQS